MATHSRILSWKIPWTEEPGGLQSMGSHRVRQNLVTEYKVPSFFFFFLVRCWFFFFFHKQVLNFVKSFLFIYFDNMAFIPQFVNMVYHNDLCLLKNPCLLGINPT